MSAAFMTALAELMSDSVTVYPGYVDWEGRWVASGASFAVTCHIEGAERRVRLRDGTETTSNLQLYLDNYYGLSERTHRFSVPARYDPDATLSALAIMKETDEDGPLYEVVYLP